MRIARVVLFLHFVGAIAHAAPQRASRVAPANRRSPVPTEPAAVVQTAPTKTVGRSPAPLNFDRLTYGDGLPNSHVTAVVQDQRGFIWLGTQDGLVRYDGTRMRVYRPSDTDTTTVSAGYITTLALTGDGKLWVGTAEHGVNLYDLATDRFTRYSLDTGQSTSGVSAIARDAKDRMWFALTRGGLTRFDPATNTFVEYAKPPLDVTVTAIDHDAQNNLWLATAASGLIRWNPDTGDSEIFKSDDTTTAFPVSPLTSVLASSTGTIWVGSDGEGLLSIEPATRKLTTHRANVEDPASLSDDHVTVLFEDKAKGLWVGTKNGLNHQQPNGGFVQYMHDPNDPASLAFPRVESLFQDAGGVMWVGGFTVGACKFEMSRAKFGRYRTRTHPVNSFYEDDDGTLWVGTYHGGLYKYEFGKQRATLYQTLPHATLPPVLLESAWIAALARDAKGTLWMALQGQGLIAFDTNQETWTQYMPDPDNPNSIPVDTIWDIEKRPDGTLWLASWGGGLVELDPATSTFTPLTTEDNVGLTSNHLYSLYPDPKEKNILWIGTAEGGLVRFDTATTKATSYRKKADDPTSLRSDDILSIHREGDVLWLGTYGGGLNRLDLATGKVKAYTTSSSQLTNDVVFGILPDGEGRLWLSTNGGGLVRFDPNGEVFLRFLAADGVQGNEFAQGAFMRSKSGKLFFGGVDGFNAFMPRDISLDSYAPPVVLTGLKMFREEAKLERPIWTVDQLQVSYSDSFEVQFAALSFAAPDQNRFAYKLEGFDDDFVETDRPFATYTKLDGGSYKLRVRAANRHGVWHETGVTVRLKVTPPFWRTWPAYIVYIALILGVVLLIAYLQRQRVRRVMREGRLAVVERDLALTGAVQTGFLPEYNEIPDGPVQLFGFYRGADACSGDWWWHETLGDRHIILVGDVTGHGPGPAMVTAAVASAFRTLVAAGFGDLRQALEVLHSNVLAVAKGKYTMTMAALELDEATGQWHLLSAGAPPMISLSREGKHRVLFCAGTPLGSEGTFEPGELTGQLQPNERVLLYTDGIPEITMPSGQTLGMRRFAQLYERTRPQGLRDAAATIVQHADESNRGKPQDDDWTFTIVEWAGADASAGERAAG